MTMNVLMWSSMLPPVETNTGTRSCAVSSAATVTVTNTKEKRTSEYAPSPARIVTRPIAKSAPWNSWTRPKGPSD